MNKKKKINRTKVDTVRSVNNNIRSSVRKLNPILKGIVGKKVDIAIRDLQFSEKRITRDIRKTISSAVANAERNLALAKKKLANGQNVISSEKMLESVKTVCFSPPAPWALWRA